MAKRRRKRRSGGFMAGRVRCWKFDVGRWQLVVSSRYSSRFTSSFFRRRGRDGAKSEKRLGIGGAFGKPPRGDGSRRLTAEISAAKDRHRFVREIRIGQPCDSPFRDISSHAINI